MTLASPARLRRAVLFDTAVASTNLGDQIIMEAVRDELEEPLAGVFITNVATHELLGRKGRSLVRAASVVVAGGSNLVSSHMWIRSVWKLSPRQAFQRLRVILMGIGWYQYQFKPDVYTRWLLRRVLHPSALHSVRDSHAKAMLSSMGIERVVNTGCPTLWRFTPQRCAALPRERGDEVVTALTSYMPDAEADRRLIDLLRSRYRRVHGWVQTAEDAEYLHALAPDIAIVEPSLRAYDRLLAAPVRLDYVGNRLHGGIRALQKGRRAIIVEIDNRAREMGRDFGLPTVARSDLARLSALVDGPLAIDIRPPMAEVDQWKKALRATLEAAP